MSDPRECTFAVPSRRAYRQHGYFRCGGVHIGERLITGEERAEIDAAANPAIFGRPERNAVAVTRKFTRSELVSSLVHAGEPEVSGEDQAEVDTYFDQERFRFHGPDGFESDVLGR